MQHTTDAMRAPEHKAGGKPLIAVVSLNTLMARGLASLIKTVMPMAEVRIFHDFIDMADANADKFFHYFITTEVLLQNPAFFTRHAGRTIVAVQGMMNMRVPKCFKTIDATLRDDDLVRVFLQMQQHAHGGGRLIPQQMRGEMARSLGRQVLTPREKEVLREIVCGRINKEIAERLNIGLTTVISHRRNLMEKLRAKSVSSLTVYAVMHGIVSADDI